MAMHIFELDSRLARDTLPVAILGLSELRLMNDRRWPWAILVPRRPGVTEIFELTPLDQTILTFETVTVSEAMKRVFGARKMNVGSLGNMVPMLHLHVVARSEDDAGWPGPVWGHGTGERYEAAQGDGMVLRLRDAVLAS
jgi:diadenosine tetraphosphate (Ap4A) HIT family hydrolase